MAANVSKKILAAITRLPDAPGIYLFYNSQKELVYAGKATSLRNRVRSYFSTVILRRQPKDPSQRKGILPRLRAGQNDRMAMPSRPIEDMIHEVADIKWKEADSVLEAIIIEANYIKKFLPKYNVIGKDNKSWNYIVITKDAFPKVQTIRQREYSVIARSEATKQSPFLQDASESKGIATPRSSGARDDTSFAYVFGPYPGLNTKAAMKILRRLFRFSNCEPGTRPCLYYQIGQCPGICVGEITPVAYREKVVRPLTTFLRGQKRQVIKMFETQMKQAGQAEHFEEAARIRDQLYQLRRIQDIALLNKTFVEDQKLETRNWKLGSEVSRVRIEGYDISNLGATEKVGSMVVFDEQGPVKSEYRKFIIRTVEGQSDVDSLAEVIQRRLNHPEWILPAVFLIDGGRAQVNRVVKTLQAISLRQVPVVGIAKGTERKRNDFILGNKDASFIYWVSNHRELLIRVRDEAHRFAVAFHRERRDRLPRPR